MSLNENKQGTQNSANFLDFGKKKILNCNIIKIYWMKNPCLSVFFDWCVNSSG